MLQTTVYGPGQRPPRRYRYPGVTHPNPDLDAVVGKWNLVRAGLMDREAMPAFLSNHQLSIEIQDLNEEEERLAPFIWDVGEMYLPEEGWFDHHQGEDFGELPALSASGLIYHSVYTLEGRSDETLSWLNSYASQVDNVERPELSGFERYLWRRKAATPGEFLCLAAPRLIDLLLGDSEEAFAAGETAIEAALLLLDQGVRERSINLRRGDGALIREIPRVTQLLRRVGGQELWERLCAYGEKAAPLSITQPVELEALYREAKASGDRARCRVTAAGALVSIEGTVPTRGAKLWAARRAGDRDLPPIALLAYRHLEGRQIAHYVIGETPLNLTHYENDLRRIAVVRAHNGGFVLFADADHQEVTERLFDLIERDLTAGGRI